MLVQSQHWQNNTFQSFYTHFQLHHQLSFVGYLGTHASSPWLVVPSFALLKLVLPLGSLLLPRVMPRLHVLVLSVAVHGCQLILSQV